MNTLQRKKKQTKQFFLEKEIFNNLWRHHASSNFGSLSPGTTTCSTPVLVITTRCATPPLTLSLPIARARAGRAGTRGKEREGNINKDQSNLCAHVQMCVSVLSCQTLYESENYNIKEMEHCSTVTTDKVNIRNLLLYLLSVISKKLNITNDFFFLTLQILQVLLCD